MRFLTLIFVLLFSVQANAQIVIERGDDSSLYQYLGASGSGTSGDPYIQTNNDFYFECAVGNISGCSVVHKFGHNPAVGTSFVPVTSDGNYRTPQVSGATTLRIKAGGNANDTAAGTGAREITFEGLDETGALVTEAVATAGASASAATTTTFIRLFRSYITASGTYATSAAGSHAATITIENGAGTEDWALIENTSFSRSQTEIAAYTVPLGKTAYVSTIHISVDSNKAADVLFFQRQNILETAAPYTPMRLTFEAGSVLGPFALGPNAPLGPFPALTDIGFMAKVASGTGDVDIDFEIILIDN